MKRRGNILGESRLILSVIIFVLIFLTPVLAENNGPIISDPYVSPEELNSSSFVNISAFLVDPDGISYVSALVTLPNGYIDEVVLSKNNISKNTIENLYSGRFSNTSIGGAYAVQVIANDSLNKVNSSNKVNFFVLDNIPPSVSNLQTIEGTSSAEFDAVMILADVYDNTQVSLVYAEITLPNKTKKEILLVPFAGSTYAADFTLIELNGEYSVKILANDSFGNVNDSEYTSFTIGSQMTTLGSNQIFSAIDLAVNSSEIHFSNNNPVEGENITINATIRNVGDLDALGVLIQFLDNGLEIQNFTINISAFSTKVLLSNLTTKIGQRSIQVKIDPDDSIIESDELNNNASKNLSISSYFTFFGKATGFLGLGLASDFLFDIQSDIKNIFITDTDSNLDFSSLQALGRKNDTTFTFNDFVELDTILGMTNFSDSINNTFSNIGGTPKQTTTFNVYGSTIHHVPIVNSTNSSTFVTGILWDYSDDANGEFDSVTKEDLVFVTKINTSQVGNFGTYDYEIKMPALLRDYKGGTSSVDIYFEIE